MVHCPSSCSLKRWNLDTPINLWELLSKKLCSSTNAFEIVNAISNELVLRHGQLKIYSVLRQITRKRSKSKMVRNLRPWTVKWDGEQLGKPSCKKSAVFLNIVQKAFDPPPLSFEHHVVNFSEGILTKVRKRLSQQLSTK